MSQRHVGQARPCRVLSCPLAGFQIFGLFAIKTTKLLSLKTGVFASFFFSGMHTVECSFGVCVVVGVQVWKAVLIFGLCCEELALISSSPSWPTMKRFDENALKLRVDGMWHLPHQTKINTGRGHFPSFRELTFINITCVSCCGHKVLETSRWWE